MRARAEWGGWRAAAALGPLVLWTATGCPSQPNVVPSRNFDRPTDMTFACMGLFVENGESRISGRPMNECHPLGKADPTPPTIKQRTFGFVTNTARGELSVIDFDKSRLVDLDPSVTGFNTVPLGVLPEAMAISDDGCRVVTANRGSCDLSVVDPGQLMSPKLKIEADAGVTPTPMNVVRTIEVKGAGVPLQVAPYEVQFLPQDVSAFTEGKALCPAGADVPAESPRAWHALVTFPSCDLVALVDIPTGNILDSVFVRAAADGKSVVLEPGGTNPSCPFVDCGAGPRRMPTTPDAGTDGGASSDAAPDGGAAAGVEAGPETSAEAGAEMPAADAPDGSAPETAAADDAAAGADGGDGGDGGGPPPIRVVDEPFIGAGPLGAAALAIHPDGTRAYVGLTNASFVAAIAIAGTTLGTPPTGASIYLHEGALGSSRIRLSVDPYGLFKAGAGVYGKFVGETNDLSRRYLYVIARDGTVRVIHVADAFRPETECDTNVDPSLLTDDDRRTACFPVDPRRPQPTTSRPPRKVLAVGPGIPVPALPRDVTVADLKLGDPDELAVDGAFAFILTSSGTVYVVNIDPTPRTTIGIEGGARRENIPEPLPLVNTLRDGNVLSYTRTLSAAAGPPRLDIVPVAPPLGPRLEGYYVMDSVDNATALGAPVPTFVFFPDRSAVAAQTWSITWEGALFADPRYSAKLDPVRNGTPLLESVLRDRGGGFCRLGVTPGDIVTLEGCADGSQCGIGQVCVPGSAGGRSAGGLPIKGLCLSSTPVRQEQQKGTCRGLLESIRRYEVVKAHPTELVVRPRPDELVKTSLNQCSVEMEGMDCAAANDPTHKDFKCIDRRCVKPCDKKMSDGKVVASDEACRAGRKCLNFGSGPAPKYLCADGPPLVQDCFEELTSYRVHAGHSFLVRGSVSAAPNTTLSIPDPEPGRFMYDNPDPQICQSDPARNPALATRIPMNSPQCTNIKGVEILDSRKRPDEDPVTNRKLLEIAHTTPSPNPCLFESGPTEGDPTDPANPRKHTRALFQNAELRFVLSNLEQPFAETLEIRFDVHGGFRPQSVVIPPDTIDIGMPARLLVSPLSALDAPVAGMAIHELPYLFVVDQRRLGRTRGSTATRGQVLRIHPQGPFQRQPIYQDATASGGLFPIQ